MGVFFGHLGNFCKKVFGDFTFSQTRTRNKDLGCLSRILICVHAGSRTSDPGFFDLDFQHGLYEFFA
jgi:hypothetical protein